MMESNKASQIFKLIKEIEVLLCSISDAVAFEYMLKLPSVKRHWQKVFNIIIQDSQDALKLLDGQNLEQVQSKPTTLYMAIVPGWHSYTTDDKERLNRMVANLSPRDREEVKVFEFDAKQLEIQRKEQDEERQG